MLIEDSQKELIGALRTYVPVSDTSWHIARIMMAELTLQRALGGTKFECKFVDKGREELVLVERPIVLQVPYVLLLEQREGAWQLLVAPILHNDKGSFVQTDLAVHLVTAGPGLRQVFGGTERLDRFVEQVVKEAHEYLMNKHIEDRVRAAKLKQSKSK